MLMVNFICTTVGFILFVCASYADEPTYTGLLKRGIKGLFVVTVISQTNERYGSWLGGLGVANVYY